MPMVSPGAVETAAALATMGARVLVTARNADKGRAAVADLAQRNDGHAQVQLAVGGFLELARLKPTPRSGEPVLVAPPLFHLYGMIGFEFEQQARESRGELETAFMLLTLGDMLGVPVMPFAFPRPHRSGDGALCLDPPKKTA